MHHHLSEILKDNFIKHIENINKKLSELNTNSTDYQKQFENLTNDKHKLEENLNKLLNLSNPNLNKYSLENIYLNYGQYDSYVMIGFFSNTISAKEYGNFIYGNFHYSRNERLKLDDSIQKEVKPFTKGDIKFNSNSNHLSINQRSNLQTKGFNIEDIFEILVIDTKENRTKKFNKKGVKTIPNIINIKIDVDNFDYLKATHSLLYNKLINGFQLADFEFNKLIGFDLFYNSNNDDLIEKFPIITNFSSNSNIRLHELEAKCYYKNITNKEIKEFNDLLITRKKYRLKIIEKEIKINQNSTLKKFKEDEENELVYNELFNSISYFDDHVLYYDKHNIPIFWDFESFTHILMRHFFPISKIKPKTVFQYNQSDIRKLLEIIIKKNISEISVKLSNNAEFTKDNLYFNGNYYKIHILKNGRVSTFYPRENPNQESSN